MRGGRFVLVAPTAAVRAYGLGDLEHRKDRLTVESWASDRRTTLLVRPDGYVAWAAESPDAATVETALAAALGD
ncbi:hypothetical protein ABZ656_29045 [Streptomyces sp. NPDC007095]|uniref:aromatic-ring hydroxylase C-terminal domain-containing protein n=1 Tax=Streptomyces sp. NPDC007095 TaxID=3154482 RepID=UPI003411A48D